MNTPQRPLLLIVDDDPLITDALGYALGRDFEILTSATRPQAMRLLHQLRAPPAAALVDLGLPPIPHQPDEGFALISELAAQAPDTRIVVLSGQDDEANARHARTLGAADFIVLDCSHVDMQKSSSAAHLVTDFLTTGHFDHSKKYPPVRPRPKITGSKRRHF